MTTRAKHSSPAAPVTRGWARKQHAIGMRSMPMANGGRTVDVFNTGASRLTGRADEGPAELRGITEGLAIRSMMCARLGVENETRGVLSVALVTPDLWTEEDLRFVEAAARWVGMVALRAGHPQGATAAHPPFD